MSASYAADFDTQVTENIREVFHLAKEGLDFLCSRFAGAVHHLFVAGEGLIHIGSASQKVQKDFVRDASTCAVETGLTVAEDVAIEVTAAIATAEAVEKIINTPAKDFDAVQITASFGESLASSAVAAIHAGVDAFHDLERSGEEWEAHHLPGAKDMAAKQETRYTLPPSIPCYI